MQRFQYILSKVVGLILDTKLKLGKVIFNAIKSVYSEYL